MDSENRVDADDQSLLAAVRGGSEYAFNTLIDRHQQVVRTFLRGLTAIRRCRMRSLGEECVRVAAKRIFAVFPTDPSAPPSGVRTLRTSSSAESLLTIRGC